MSVATSADDGSDIETDGGWSMGLLGGRSNDTGTYEYNYLDEDVYVGRGGFSFLIPSGKSRWLIGIFLLASILIVLVPRQKEEDGDQPAVPRKFKGAPQYVCDGDPLSGTDLYREHAYAGYQNTTTTTTTSSSTGEPESITALLTHNFSLFRDTFRNAEYQNWGRSYTQIQESIRPWVVERYLPHLKTGDSLFESGCGIGLNLLMTLEILQDNDVRDLHLYGSTFAPAVYANRVVEGILSEVETVGGGKPGSICSAHALDLGFVPRSSFDLVFSGHVVPELDAWVEPRSEDTEQTTRDDYGTAILKREQVCAARDSDWKSAALVRVAQEKQNQWYGKWVNEMVRIAKPGAPVILQNVLNSYCSAPEADPLGAGVPASFWLQGAEEYGWDVDPESIAVASDALFPNRQRYHVFMKKTSRLNR